MENVNVQKGEFKERHTNNKLLTMSLLVYFKKWRRREITPNHVSGKSWDIHNHPENYETHEISATHHRLMKASPCFKQQLRRPAQLGEMYLLHNILHFFCFHKGLIYNNFVSETWGVPWGGLGLDWAPCVAHWMLAGAQHWAAQEFLDPLTAQCSDLTRLRSFTH